MKQTVFAISILMNFLVLGALVIWLNMPVQVNAGSEVVIINDSGETLAGFTCSYLVYSIRIDSLYPDQSLDFQFEGTEYSPIELHWRFGESSTTIEYGYFGTHIHVDDSVRIDGNFKALGGVDYEIIKHRMENL